MAPISVTLEREDPPVGIVTLEGEHDAYSAPRVENELALLLDEGLAVVVDLGHATFIDSQTLSVLLSGRHQAERAQLGFALVLPEGDYTQVHRILNMTGLGSWFATAPTLAQAIAVARDGRNAGERLRVA
jgi:anti-sigma B factor antagonist